MSRFIFIASLALAAGLLASPASATTTTTLEPVAVQAAGFTRLALNPQPEPPGKAKNKRIFIKEMESKDQKKVKTPVAPATKY